MSLLAAASSAGDASVDPSVAAWALLSLRAEPAAARGEESAPEPDKERQLA